MFSLAKLGGTAGQTQLPHLIFLYMGYIYIYMGYIWDIYILKILLMEQFSGAPKWYWLVLCEAQGGSTAP